MKDFVKEDALALSWIVMSRSPLNSSLYEKAEKYWKKYADESVVGNRPSKIEIRIK